MISLHEFLFVAFRIINAGIIFFFFIYFFRVVAYPMLIEQLGARLAALRALKDAAFKQKKRINELAQERQEAQRQVQRLLDNVNTWRDIVELKRSEKEQSIQARAQAAQQKYQHQIAHYIRVQGQRVVLDQAFGVARDELGKEFNDPAQQNEFINRACEKLKRGAYE